MPSRAPARERIEVSGPAGRIECLVELPETVRAVGLMLHPHPLHQGTMDNKVVHALARGCLVAGAAAIRFNFRGVGGSEGGYGGGRGEQDDAAAVADWARGRWPGLPLCMGGFSFGAMVALGACGRIAPDILVTVAPPVASISASVIQPGCPWLVIQGDEDEIVNVEEVIAWLNALGPGPELTLFRGASHFFHGRLNELRDGVAAFLSANLPT